MGLQVTTDDKGVRVFRKDRQTKNGGTFATYSLKVASKDKDGNWLNGYIDCQFKKGVSVNNKADIKINNAFYVANEYNGKTYTKIMITDFTVIKDGDAPVQQSGDDFMTIPDDAIDEIAFD